MGCSMQCGGTARHVFVNGGQHRPPLPQPCRAVRLFHFALLRSPFDASWTTCPACRKPARRRSLKAPAVCCSMSRTLSPSPTTVRHSTALLPLLDRGGSMPRRGIRPLCSRQPAGCSPASATAVAASSLEGPCQSTACWNSHVVCPHPGPYLLFCDCCAQARVWAGGML
jgi:hypothetical protein